jgi:hypothetical protein
MWHVWDKREVNARFWWGNLKERKESVRRAWAGFIWLRIGRSCGLL